MYNLKLLDPIDCQNINSYQCIVITPIHTIATPIVVLSCMHVYAYSPSLLFIHVLRYPELTKHTAAARMVSSCQEHILQCNQ